MNEDATHQIKMALADQPVETKVRTETHTVGDVGAILLAFHEDNPLVWIRNVGSTQTGVGTQLVKTAARRVKEEGKTGLILVSVEDAVGFYLKLGFTRGTGYKRFEMCLVGPALKRLTDRP